MKGGIAMKKYEKPMVELTKFNAEDIIATSGDKRVEAIVTGGTTYAPSDDATKTFDTVEVFNW